MLHIITHLSNLVRQLRSSLGSKNVYIFISERASFCQRRQERGQRMGRASQRASGPSEGETSLALK